MGEDGLPFPKGTVAQSRAGQEGQWGFWILGAWWLTGLPLNQLSDARTLSHQVLWHWAGFFTVRFHLLVVYSVHFTDKKLPRKGQ